jgi:hypothetical protein
VGILDDKLLLSDKQRICFTAATTRTLSTNLIDLGAEDLGIGAGTPLYLSIRTCATFTHGAPLTGGITFKLKSATGTAQLDAEGQPDDPVCFTADDRREALSAALVCEEYTGQYRPNQQLH